MAEETDTLPITGTFLALILITLVFGVGESMVTSSTAAMVAEQTKARGHGTSMGVSAASGMWGTPQARY